MFAVNSKSEWKRWIDKAALFCRFACLLPAQKRHRSGLGLSACLPYSEQRLELQSCLVDCAVLHCRYKVEHVAFGLAREALKRMLAEFDMRGPVAFSAVDWSTAPEFTLCPT